MASRRALALTAALHTAILAAALGMLPQCAGGEGGDGDNGSGKQSKKLHSVEPAPLQVQLLAEGQTFDAPPPAAAAEPACADGSYVGIGVVVNPSGKILMTGDNTPASRAGLLVDDVIVNVAITGPNRYPAGAVIALRVRRGDEEERFVAVRVGKVCY
jgi:hypothetical protein